MRLYFNRKPVSGPWGGGTKILRAIVNVALARGHEVYLEEQIDLCDRVDAVVCVDPRATGHVSYQRVRDLAHRSSCPLIQRVGDLGTHGKPELLDALRVTIPLSDITVFPSDWALSYAENAGIRCRRAAVVRNGADPLFFRGRSDDWHDVRKGAVSLVTHHWSSNQLKGFDLYTRLSSFCLSRDNFRFTYIGRAPDSARIHTVMGPLDVPDLVRELPKHNVYVTASKHEAGANHVLEAMAVGLPVLYHRDGGSIPEYCTGRGIEYSTFEELVSILDDIEVNVQKLSGCLPYSRTTEDAGREILDIVEGAVS